MYAVLGGWYVAEWLKYIKNPLIFISLHVLVIIWIIYETSWLSLKQTPPLKECRVTITDENPMRFDRNVAFWDHTKDKDHSLIHKHKAIP